MQLDNNSENSNAIWAIGNGESRQYIDIHNLCGIKIGCNAIHRDYSVDHLVCVDRKMILEAVAKQLWSDCKIYTRKNHLKFHPELFSVPELPFEKSQRADQPEHWGSGPYAVLIASQLGNQINLLGFDLYSTNSFVNNVYKDTHGYVSQTHHKIDPKYWIYQIGKIFLHYPNNEYIIYTYKDWEMPESWQLPNVSVLASSRLINSAVIKLTQQQEARDGY